MSMAYPELAGYPVTTRMLGMLGGNRPGHGLIGIDVCVCTCISLYTFVCVHGYDIDRGYICKTIHLFRSFHVIFLGSKMYPTCNYFNAIHMFTVCVQKPHRTYITDPLLLISCIPKRFRAKTGCCIHPVPTLADIVMHLRPAEADVEFDDPPRSSRASNIQRQHQRRCR